MTSETRQKFDVEGKVSLRSPLFKTCTLFVGLMLAMHVVLWLVAPVWRATDPLRDLTTSAVSSVLVMLHISNVVNGYAITLHNDIWIVTQECTAINVLILHVSFVLAYAASFRAKILALATGVPLILLANLARLVTLGLLTEYVPQKAHFFHDYVWEALFMFFVIAMWLVWIEVIVNREGNHSIFN